MRGGAHSVGGAILVAALCLFSGANPAAAECSPDAAVFSDDFSDFLDPTWGDADDTMYVEDDALILKSNRQQVNFSTQGQDVNACVDITIADAPVPDYTSVGMIFWWSDWDNYYDVSYWPNGLVNISRVVKGKANFLIAANPKNFNKGVGQTNSLEIDLKGKTATLLVNGQVATRFKGIPPKNPGPIGLVAYGGDGKPSTFKFDNFIVSEAAP